MTEIVFISSCASERSGQAFVEAGVPHVVAVKVEERITGESLGEGRQEGGMVARLSIRKGHVSSCVSRKEQAVVILMTLRPGEGQ